MAGSRTGSTSPQNRPGSPGGQDSGPGMVDQVQGAMRSASETASELWDDAYEQGQRYYRQGSQVVGEVDTATLTGWLVAGGIGFGLAWLFFGRQSWGTDDIARRMSQSSDRPSGGRDHRGRR